MEVKISSLGEGLYQVNDSEVPVDTLTVEGLAIEAGLDKDTLFSNLDFLIFR